MVLNTLILIMYSDIGQLLADQETSNCLHREAVSLLPALGFVDTAAQRPIVSGLAFQHCQCMQEGSFGVAVPQHASESSSKSE